MGKRAMNSGGSRFAEVEVVGPAGVVWCWSGGNTQSDEWSDEWLVH